MSDQNRHGICKGAIAMRGVRQHTNDNPLNQYVDYSHCDKAHGQCKGNIPVWILCLSHRD